MRVCYHVIIPLDHCLFSIYIFFFSQYIYFLIYIYGKGHVQIFWRPKKILPANKHMIKAISPVIEEMQSKAVRPLHS